MARSHAKITTVIWRDPSWTGLTLRAQWLYMLLLSQQGLTLVGSLDLTPGKWATFAQGVTRDAVQAALDELEDDRFLVIDHATGEVLVRSFTRHDIDPNRVNVNLAKGLWGQWGCIASPSLRSVAIHEMPGDIWDRLEPHAPVDAKETRRSTRLEPVPRIPVANPNDDPGRQPPPSSLLPPVTNHPPGPALPVQVELDHHPTPKVDPADIEERRTELDLLKQAHPHLVKGPS